MQMKILLSFHLSIYQDHLVHSCPDLVWIWLTQIGWSEINYDLEESLLHKVGVEEERHIDINESKYFVTFLDVEKPFQANPIDGI